MHFENVREDNGVKIKLQDREQITRKESEDHTLTCEKFMNAFKHFKEAA